MVGLNGIAQTLHGVGHQTTRLTEKAFPSQIMSQAGSHGAAITYELSEFRFRQRQNVGFDDRQMRTYVLSIIDVQLRTSEHRSMYSYVRLSIDRCTLVRLHLDVQLRRLSSYVRLSIDRCTLVRLHLDVQLTTSERSVTRTLIQ